MTLQTTPLTLPAVRRFTAGTEQTPPLEYVACPPAGESTVRQTAVLIAPGSNHTIPLYQTLAAAIVDGGVPTSIMNFRGHGESGLLPEQPLRQVRLADFAQDIEAVRQDMGANLGGHARKIVVVGHSLGGLIAWDHASTYPTDGLVMFGSLMARHGWGSWRSTQLFGLMAWLAFRHPGVLRSFGSNGNGNVFPDEAVRKRLLLSAHQHPEWATPEVLAELDAWVQPDESTQVFADIMRLRPGNLIPTAKHVLYVFGTSDALFPLPLVVREVGQWPGAQLATFDGPHDLNVVGDVAGAGRRIAEFAGKIDRDEEEA